MYKVYLALTLIALATSASVFAQEAQVCAAPASGFIELEYELMQEDLREAQSPLLAPPQQVARQVGLLGRLKERLLPLWRAREGGSLTNAAYQRRIDELLSREGGVLMSSGRFRRVGPAVFIGDTNYPIRVEELVQLLPRGDALRMCVFQVTGSPSSFTIAGTPSDPLRQPATLLSCSVLNLATGQIHGNDPLGTQVLAQTGPDLDGSSGIDSEYPDVLERAIRYRALLGLAMNVSKEEYIRRRTAGEFGSFCAPVDRIDVQIAQDDDVDWRRLFPATSPGVTGTVTAPSAN